MQCQSYAAQLGRHYEDLKSAGFDVLVVLGEPIERAVKYADLLKLPYPVLADPERAVYHQYGLDKAVIVIQRTASIIVDRAGIIRYLRQATNPITWLSEMDRLLAAAKELPREE